MTGCFEEFTIATASAIASCMESMSVSYSSPLVVLEYVKESANCSRLTGIGIDVISRGNSINIFGSFSWVINQNRINSHMFEDFLLRIKVSNLVMKKWILFTFFYSRRTRNHYKRRFFSKCLSCRVKN